MTAEDMLDPRSDVVAGQYQRWMYPEPIEDLPGWLEHHWQWFDPSHAHPVLWPERGYRPDMEILVAGCGTNQAAVLAYTNPQARVVAIDVSQPSLDHHEYLKSTYGLHNLEIQLMPIEEVGTLNREFDLIISTGVLHHLADPQVGANTLAQCLRPGGVMGLMLYAHTGRIGVEMMEDVFRELNLRQDEESVALVKQALASLPEEHPVRSYLATAPDLQFDAGLVDTFLHGRQRSYTVEECLDLVEQAGLDFHGWFLASPYEPVTPPTTTFMAAVAALPDRRRWSVMERINTRNGCHFFLARNPGDDVLGDIDLSAPGAGDLIPVFRHRCGLAGSEVVRPAGPIALDPAQRAVVDHIDGHRTIGQIAAAVTAADPALFDSTEKATAFTRSVVRSLRDRDAVAVVISRE